ncbi:hypothetical protein AAFF_G00393160 [Aldrovandia affinis]|uniref:Uncharacterized protein n=1 Tax=Aldrovandia affinis TaxID=143900 RepID=A0AAD7SDG1_9TELE|nr:hypothetical protein AAFF_G00393160 [Aldrovandia affinis]
MPRERSSSRGAEAHLHGTLHGTLSGCGSVDFVKRFGAVTCNVPNGFTRLLFRAHRRTGTKGVIDGERSGFRTCLRRTQLGLGLGLVWADDLVVPLSGLRH